MKYRIYSLILLQKHIRGYLVKKQYAPKIKLSRQLKSLEKKLSSIQENSIQIKSRQNIDDAVQRMRDNISSTLESIKVREFMIDEIEF